MCHTEVTERNPMIGEDNRARGFSISICCCIILQSNPAFANWLKALAMKVGYHNKHSCEQNDQKTGGEV